MKSKASFKGHPIHPILIVFPVAFLFGAFSFDLLSIFLHKVHFAIMAFYLAIAGIAGGLLAAVPGIIDYIYTIPPESSAKKRGTKHAIVNTTAILLFGLSVYLKLKENGTYPLIITTLEGIGIILMAIGGYMGGTLVYKNQIGVDIRYAEAGRWKEEYISKNIETGSAIKVTEGDELKLNQMKLIHVNGKRIVLGLTEDGYTAFEDRCTHKGGSLAGGALIKGTVQCPWHGTQFDVHNGNTKCGPGNHPITTYKIEVSDGNVFLIV